MYCFAIKVERFRAWIKSSFPPNPNKIHSSALLHWDMSVLLRLFQHVDQDFQIHMFGNNSVTVRRVSIRILSVVVLFSAINKTCTMFACIMLWPHLQSWEALWRASSASCCMTAYSDLISSRMGGKPFRSRIADLVW